MKKKYEKESFEKSLRLLQRNGKNFVPLLDLRYGNLRTRFEIECEQRPRQRVDEHGFERVANAPPAIGKIART